MSVFNERSRITHVYLDANVPARKVRVATTANGTLATAFANNQTVDGITLATGDRILLKNQSTASQNGIYIVQASGAPVRADDANTGPELVGALVIVQEGSTNADTQWLCTNDSITIGSTSITFAQSAGSGAYQPLNATLTALAGLTAPTATVGTPAVTLSVQNSGDTNNSASGSGSDYTHNLNYVVPANFLVSGRALRITAHFRITSGSVAPTLVHKLFAGAVNLVSSVAIAPQANRSNDQYALSWILQATAAPSASSNVECANLATPTAPGAGTTINQTDMPVALATNGALTLQVATQWGSAGTGTSTITLSQFIVEALN